EAWPFLSKDKTDVEPGHHVVAQLRPAADEELGLLIVFRLGLRNEGANPCDGVTVQGETLRRGATNGLERLPPPAIKATAAIPRRHDSCWTITFQKKSHQFVTGKTTLELRDVPAPRQPRPRVGLFRYQAKHTQRLQITHQRFRRTAIKPD